jgi:peptidoglycan/LPS O-acetylase OafA/YrhL
LSLEAGRFVAALGVAAFHVEGAVQKLIGRYDGDNLFRAGHAGVEYFFVLSGFIIYWIHHSDIGVPSSVGRFLARRAIRILPMYWLAYACMAFGLAVFPSLLQGRAFGQWDYVQDLLLLPRSGEMVLGVAWTLRQEFVFYLIFALCISLPRVGLWPVIAWQAAVVVYQLFFPGDASPILKVVFNLYNLGFGAGILVARVVLKGGVPTPRLVIAIAGAALLATLFVETSNGRNLPHVENALGTVIGPLLYIGFGALLVLGMTSLDLHGSTKRVGATSSIVSILGGASYLLYLFHGMVTSVLLRLVGGVSILAGSPGILLTLLLAVAVSVSVVMHLMLEKPVLKALNRSRRRTRPQKVAL